MQTPLKIIFEDDWLIAVDKPGRVATVPDSHTTEAESLLGMAKKHFEKKDFSPYVLHRLDYATSGIVLMGKYERDREPLTAILRHPETSKTYTALVMGTIEPRRGEIHKKIPSRYNGTLVEAHTSYRVTRVFPEGLFSVVEAMIATGRKHQIRRHFASIHHPIIMDDLYGDKKINQKFRKIFRLGRQFLHASSIEFIHPITQKKIHILSHLPMDLLSTIKRMSGTQD